MIPSGYGRYAKAAVAVQKKEDILLLLLDTASTDLKKARMGIEDNNPKVKGESISRAIGILNELDCALDHEVDSDMSENLSRLYRFMMDRLILANLKTDVAALDEAAQVLEHLHEAFCEAAKTHKMNHRPESMRSFDNAEKSAYQMTGRVSVAV
jgi:flagellar protein FliS